MFIKLEELLDHHNQKPIQFYKEHPIYIYGTGTVSQVVYQVLASKGLDVKGFIDHNHRESPIKGVPTFKPETISLSERGSALVILAIHNYQVDMHTLMSGLTAMGYGNLVTMIDLYDHFALELGERYWLMGRSFYKKYKSQIDETESLWDDEVSRDIYAKTLEFRVTANYSLLPKPDLTHCYFPNDIPPWIQPIRLIDCGAYDGNTVDDFIKNGYSLSAVIVFEPDLINYPKIVKYFQKQLQIISEVSLWPCGVYSRSAQLSFAEGRGAASGISKNGNTIIQCVALDDALPNFRPTLIKMDIEGAELDALQGTERIITKYHPGLAVSVYHTPTHLWEIPLWISQFAKKHGIHYTFHLRAHAYNSFDTVFYAIPF